MSTKQHGGLREGAGRKSHPLGKTTILRVPERCVDEIQSFIKNRSLQSTQAQTVQSDVASIVPLMATTRLAIPVALEKIAAGFPSPAQDHIEKTIDMNEHLIRNPEATFVVKVASESMLNAGLAIDDELIVDRSLDAKHGDIVVALIDSDFTVKRLMIEGEHMWLKAENPLFKDIHIAKDQQLQIWGVVTRVIKRLR